MPRRPGAFASAFVMGTLLAVLWVLEFIDQATGGSLDVPAGIRSHDESDLGSIVTAPFLHANWNHLISNSVPFFVLGFFVLLAGTARWLVTTSASMVTSGLAAWALSAPNTITLGASGVIFGWLLYLLIQGLRAHDWRQLLVGIVVLFLYGGALVGLLPSSPYVSWQAHLGGAIGGGAVAWWYQGRRGRSRAPRA